jgi:NADH-quinone oxidoreductase subunit E
LTWHLRFAIQAAVPVLSQNARTQIAAATTHYPTKLAALLPALHIVQDELGHIPADAALEVAEALDVPPTRVHEVITFYTMFYDRPVGRHLVKICRNLACALRGADRLIACARETLGVAPGETTADGRITLDTEECLASCGTGPMLWHRSGADERIHENLTEEKLVALLESLP